MENEVLLQVKGLSFTYGEEPVLKDVNLIIRRGEKIAVMGSNGAGKSTFFLNLNGVLKPDSGEILLGGSKIGKKELNLLHKKVGFVFQDAGQPDYRGECTGGNFLRAHESGPETQ